MKPADDNRMGRRTFMKMSAAATAAAAAGSMAAGCGTNKKPNIVFVFSDEHRWQSLPFTDMPQVKAPNMKKMVAAGTRIDNNCSTSPICMPYRAMLITGQWPHQNSCVSNNWFGDTDVIGISSPTIAHYFKKAGYTTGYVGKWHLHNETCKNAGFDYFQHWLYGDDHWETKVRDVVKGEEFHMEKGYNAIGMTDQAFEFMDAQKDSDVPFLLMLSLNPPHWRWDDAPEEFLNMYPEDKMDYPPNVPESYKERKNFKLHYRHYHAHISAIDREVGRISDYLTQTGLAEETIFIYTSDHGSSFGSNGVGSKANPFDEAVRTPFFASWPGRIPAGRALDTNMNTVDVFATLCGFAGIPTPEQCDGQDFSNLILGGSGADPDAQLLMVNNFIRNYYKTEVDGGFHNWFCPFRGVRTKTHTFVVAEKGDWLLYDNANDPHQQNNLVDDPAHTELKEQLRARLMELLAVAEDPYIPEEWKKLPLHERIAVQNRHYSIQPSLEQWAAYKKNELAPYLKKADATRTAALTEAADSIYDEAFIGRYLALHNGVHGKKRHTNKPVAEVQRMLDAHEKQYRDRFAREAARIMG